MHWLPKLCLLSISSIWFFGNCEAQIIPRKDTVQRDIGVSINWRSLPLIPQSSKVSDIVGGVHFAFETRAHNFWIQTGILVNWNSERAFDKGHDVLISLSTPYEFSILKDRLILGVGPISSYRYTFEEQVRTEGLTSWVETRRQHVASMGINFEVTVPIWKGLSFETCSDIGPGIAFHDNGNRNLIIAATRLVSVGINYRIPAYPK